MPEAFVVRGCGDAAFNGTYVSDPGVLQLPGMTHPYRQLGGEGTIEYCTETDCWSLSELYQDTFYVCTRADSHMRYAPTPPLKGWITHPDLSSGKPPAPTLSATTHSAVKPSSQATESLKFYHGTSWDRAREIQKNGFIPSSGGCLGEGIYVAREDKARRFAENTSRNGGAGGGGLIEVIITFSNPAYVTSDDTTWQRKGHDACRADHTGESTNMEWCVKSNSQVRVVNISRVG